MNMVVNLDDYVSAPVAAEMLDINYPAFWARIKRGQVPSLQIGRFHLIKKSVIQEIKEEEFAHDNTPCVEQTAR